MWPPYVSITLLLSHISQVSRGKPELPPLKQSLYMFLMLNSWGKKCWCAWVFPKTRNTGSICIYKVGQLWFSVLFPGHYCQIGKGQSLDYLRGNSQLLVLLCAWPVAKRGDSLNTLKTYVIKFPYGTCSTSIDQSVSENVWQVLKYVVTICRQSVPERCYIFGNISVLCIKPLSICSLP